MTIKVDPDRCQGHARCFTFAPDAFDFDDEGYSFVVAGKDRYDDKVPADIKLAIGNCPERVLRNPEKR